MRFLTSRTPHRGHVGSGSSRTRFSHRGNDGTHPCRTAVPNTLFIVVCNLRTSPASRLLTGRDGLSLPADLVGEEIAQAGDHGLIHQRGPNR